MRRLVILAIAFAALEETRFGSSGPPSHGLVVAASAVDTRIAEFHGHWNRFMREYLGCPKAATEIEQCDRNQGVFDYAEFLRAARAGRELFDEAR